MFETRSLELDFERSASYCVDVGAGLGWPGIYLAQVMGCNVILVDLPLVGLQAALERAAADGLRQRCRAVLADGALLPLRNGTFDALSHSDVLCCMSAKVSILRACRWVARAGAKMAFPFSSRSVAI